MNLWLARKGDALVPDSPESAAEFARLPFGRSLHCEVTRPRSVQMHRLYFALVRRIAQAKGVPADAVDYVLRIAAGHCKTIRTQKYGDLRVAKSLQFAKCDQLEFSEFFNYAIAAAYDEFGIDPSVFADLLIPPEHEAQSRAA